MIIQGWKEENHVIEHEVYIYTAVRCVAMTMGRKQY